MKKRKWGLHLAALCLVLTTLSCASVEKREAKEVAREGIPERPLLNDLTCLGLSPALVPVKFLGCWVGLQIEHASFFDKTARFSSGRKISAPEKVLFGVFVMPLSAVVSVPVSAVVTTGSFGGHVVELFTLPFGKPLKFYRLSDFGHGSE